MLWHRDFLNVIGKQRLDCFLALLLAIVTVLMGNKDYVGLIIFFDFEWVSINDLLSYNFEGVMSEPVDVINHS